MAYEQLGNTQGRRWGSQEFYSGADLSEDQMREQGITGSWSPASGMSQESRNYQEEEAKKREIEAAQRDAAAQLVLGKDPLGNAIYSNFGLSEENQQAELERRKKFLEQAMAAQNMQAPQVIDPEVQASMRAAALGQGPSAAQAQLNQAQSQLLRDQMALAGSARGSGVSRYAAQQAAQENMSRMGGQFADQAAALRAQEMQGARGQYLQGAGLTGEMAMRQQDINRQKEFGYLALEQQMYQAALERGMRASEAAAAARQGVMRLRSQEQENSSNRTMGYVGGLLGAIGTGVALTAPMWMPGKSAPTRTSEAPLIGPPSDSSEGDFNYGSRGIWGRA